MENGYERVELHLHSKMSDKVSLIRPEEAVALASELGHKACAFADCGSVQAFPAFYDAVRRLNCGREEKFKAIFGYEGLVLDDGPTVFYNLPHSADKTLTVDEITSVALQVNEDNETFIRVAASKFRLDHSSNEYVHIEDFLEDVDDKIYSGKGEPCGSYFCMERLSEFIGNGFITGENIFDVLGLLRRAGFGVDIESHEHFRVKFNMPAISIEDIKKYACPKAVPALADDLTDKAFNAGKYVVDYMTGEGTSDPAELNRRIGHKTRSEMLFCEPYNIVLLAKDSLGIYNLYRLVSEAHVNYLSEGPRIPLGLVRYYGSSLLIGSSCDGGEVFRYAESVYSGCGKDRDRALEIIKKDDEFGRMMSFYDYIELQPLGGKAYLYDLKLEDPKAVNTLIVDAAEAYGKPVVAVSDARYLEKEDAAGLDCIHESLDIMDIDPMEALYYRDTEEMLDEFSYLGPSRAYDIVVRNTNLIADKIEYGIRPFPDGVFLPDQSEASSEVSDSAYAKAEELYGKDGIIAPAVKERLDTELGYITGNGYSIFYNVAQRIVKKNHEEGYNVGFRGLTGNSLVAFLLGITEVNPLAPHYLCPKCKHLEFTDSVSSGFDLPSKDCPECGSKMRSDGHDLPLELFMGYYGDKQPDIDLNLASESLKSANEYLRKWRGESFVYRAGVIMTYSERRARQMVHDYNPVLLEDEIDRYSRAIEGVKKGTSAHPGVVYIVPEKMDVYEFTPVQYLSNRPETGELTTHFDFRSLHDVILKIDFLGNGDIRMLNCLQDITGIKTDKVPLDDPEVMSLIRSADTAGFSELGRDYMRSIIRKAEPSCFNDIVHILGVAHGTGIWIGNAERLLDEGVCDIGSVPAFRDTVMTCLLRCGMDRKEAYDITEFVRKGKAATSREADRWERYKSHMAEHNVPGWFIDCCEKIRYMFPKGHAVGYAMNELRLAWYKKYYPVEYYCAYLTEWRDFFDPDYMYKGSDVIRAKMRGLTERIADDPDGYGEYEMCKVIADMLGKGISFTPDSIGKKDIVRFIKAGDGLIRAL